MQSPRNSPVYTHMGGINQGYKGRQGQADCCSFEKKKRFWADHVDNTDTTAEEMLGINVAECQETLDGSDIEMSQVSCDVPDSESQDALQVDQTLYTLKEVNIFLDETLVIGYCCIFFFLIRKKKLGRSVVMLQKLLSDC